MNSTPTPRIGLEQWRALIAVVDAGGYAQAAEALNKSQSAVTYSVQKLEAVLDVKAFEIHGRKAVLTPTGQLLYRRARALLDEAGALEKSARSLSAGWEPEIRIAVEVLFPTWLILDCLDRFGAEAPDTRIELIESVISGTQEALLSGHAALAIAGSIPAGFTGDHLIRLRMVVAASPDHALHQLKRKLTLKDLRAHRQLVVRETGQIRGARTTVEATQRWTVSNMSSSIIAARAGYGYGWFPEYKIRDELDANTLKALPLREGGERFIELYLVFADRDAAGPGTLRLAEIIRESIAGSCRKHATAAR
ncbi:MAG: LysR family transcriptional regulator [Betaproteobacteria bacterium]|nr:LysR family transcriptional regulator [Betaproteobacteria bacterium]